MQIAFVVETSEGRGKRKFSVGNFRKIFFESPHYLNGGPGTNGYDGDRGITLQQRQASCCNFHGSAAEILLLLFCLFRIFEESLVATPLSSLMSRFFTVH